MEASVVVPTYNRAEGLRRLLRSLGTLERTRPAEVIVVDDASTDHTPDVARSFGVRYVRAPENGGPARARNMGVELARGDVVAFTDSDCITHRHWLHRLVGKLASGPCGGVGGRVLPLAKDVFSLYYTFHRILDPPASCKYLVSANCAYRRADVLQVGGFDEEIRNPGGEDVALSFKLHGITRPFAVERRAVVWHDYRRGLRDFARTFWNYGYGCRRVTDKYLADRNDEPHPH